jgi:hypothetical protein
MVYFDTENPKLGINFLDGLGTENVFVVIYFKAIWNTYVMAIWKLCGY